MIKNFQMFKEFTLLALFLCVFVQISIVNATTYTVGDDKGWSFGVESWPNGKPFKAGDVLVFKYSPEYHNVIVVNEENYKKCEATGKTYNSGNDQFKLAKGTTYFLCGIGRHCEEKMKIAVTAN